MKVDIPCICPKPRHEKDTVTLPDRLAFRQLIAIRQNLGTAMQAEGITQGEVVGELVENYILIAPTAWSCVDEKGKPLPLSRANVTSYLLANIEAAQAVGEAADGLYSDVVTLPLQRGASTSSSDSPTEVPTSPTTGDGSTPQPKRSKRSSTSTTPMAVTGPMQASPAGASSSLQS